MAGISKTVVSIKPGKMEEIYKLIDSQSHYATELDGLIGFLVPETGDHEITIIGVYDKTASAEAASGAVQKVFAEGAELMASQPNRGVYSGKWYSS